MGMKDWIGSLTQSRIPVRGFPGPGRGAMTITTPPQLFEATSVQLGGLFPFITGAPTLTAGAPLGHHLVTGSLVCADPISCFEQGIILNPSLFILGLPALGKSGLMKRMALGASAMGVIPLVLNDLKPDYVRLIEVLGGQVITLAPGVGKINVVAIEEANQAASLLTEAGYEREAAELLGDARSRRQTILTTIIEMQRRAPLSDRENAILVAALDVLDQDEAIPRPELADVLRVIQSRHPQVRSAALDRGDDDRYVAHTDALEASLVALVTGGRFGTMFDGQSTVTMDMARPIVFDISALDAANEDVQAAVMLAAWNMGFGNIEIAHALADAKLVPRRRYLVYMDELWRVLRAGSGLVDKVDRITRLNRTIGTGTVMASHTMSDLDALVSEHDRKKAAGFVERSGAVMLAGLPQEEMTRLGGVLNLSAAEQHLLMSWSGAPPISDDGRKLAPPGRGKFLFKPGKGNNSPGIPFQVTLTATELSEGIMDTDQRWEARHV